MKIVLIGPIYPYKGGIAHYTSLMCKALRVNHDVEMVSYKMQYPKLLFKKEQKDFSNRSFAVENTQYLINTANPFNLVVSATKIKKMKPDVIIFQWWHPYFAPCYYIVAKLLKTKKAKIMFVCHNVFPHEHFPMDRWLSKVALKQGDYFLVQSHLDERDLLSIKKDARYIVTPHPTYNVFKMQDMSRESARKLLKIQSSVPVMLFFGFVREYKGLKYLIKALPMIRERIADIQLWVVGDFGDDKEEYVQLIEKKGVRDNLVMVEGYIPDQEVEKYFAATDLVVLPYTSATQSGIVQIAYGFEKPVVATNVGGLPDVVEDGRTGYIVEKENERELADAVVKFFNTVDGQSWGKNIREKADEFSWETMVKRIETLVTM